MEFARDDTAGGAGDELVDAQLVQGAGSPAALAALAAAVSAAWTAAASSAGMSAISSALPSRVSLTRT